jgi:hypothetical protein
MIKQDDPHAALVFRVLPPGKGHPLANQLGVAPSGIPLFPVPAQAAKELNQTKYFRSCWSTMTMAASPVLHWSGRPGQGWGLRHIFATKWEFYIGPHSSLVTR